MDDQSAIVVFRLLLGVFRVRPRVLFANMMAFKRPNDHRTEKKVISRAVMAAAALLKEI